MTFSLRARQYNRRMLNDKNKKYYAPNVIKTIKILELLAQTPLPLTQKEISKHTGYSTSIVFRILTTLEDCEYLAKDENRKYTISKKFAPISISATSQDDLIHNSLDILAQIRDNIMETTMLGVLVDGIFVVILQEQGKYSFSFHCKIGTRCPLHTGAGSKALMAFLPEKERDAIVERMKFEKFNANTITSKSAFKKELERVAKCGYAFDMEEYIHGMRCVGAPIFNDKNYPIAAVWATGPSDRMAESSLPEWGAYIAEQANRISQRLGATCTK